MDVRVIALALAALVSASSLSANELPSEQATSVSAFDTIDKAVVAGRLEEASAMIARAKELGSSPGLQLEIAEYALATGDLPIAEATFTALTSTKELAARAQQGLGLTHLRQGETVRAIGALNAALELDPNLVRALIGRGVAADQSQDWSHAENYYGRAIQLEPNSAVALNDRGYSRLSHGRSAEAVVDLEQALKIDPQMQPARTNLQLAHAMSGNYKAAFLGATKATLAHDLNTVGFAAMARGEYAVAEAYFTRAMEINPQFDRTAWGNLVYVKQLAHSASNGSVAP